MIKDHPPDRRTAAFPPNPRKTGSRGRPPPPAPPRVSLRFIPGVTISPPGFSPAGPSPPRPIIPVETHFPGPPGRVLPPTGPIIPPLLGAHIFTGRGPPRRVLRHGGLLSPFGGKLPRFPRPAGPPPFGFFPGPRAQSLSAPDFPPGAPSPCAPPPRGLPLRSPCLPGHPGPRFFHCY